MGLMITRLAIRRVADRSPGDPLALGRVGAVVRGGRVGHHDQLPAGAGVVDADRDCGGSAAISPHSWSGRPAARADPGRSGVVVLAIIGDQWRGDGSPAARLAAARPTITAPGIEEIRNRIQPTDRIACTDELGCLMLVNRIDAWLALDDYVRERFLVRRGDKRSSASTPACRGAAPRRSVHAQRRRPASRADADHRRLQGVSDRQFSRPGCPRALEADGLQVLPLLETPQLRVLQVSPAESVAARQP